MRWLVVCMAASLFVACGTPRGEESASPTAIVPASAPAATITAQGIDLPGRLLFVRGGNLWLWQGSVGTQITDQANLFQPAWSPDGRTIAAARRGPSVSDIVLLPASGGPERVITDGDSTAPINSFERARSTIWSFYPSFSPDGQMLAYASQAGPAVGEPASDYNLTLYESPVTVGGERMQLYASDMGHVGRLAYAPDGAIVLAFQPAGEEPRVLLRYTDGDVSEIPGVPEHSYDPSISADGAWLTFATKSGDATDVYAVPAGGGTPTRLTNVGVARAPAISPDGAWLAFLALTAGTSSFDVWVAPLTLGAEGIQAGEPRPLTQNMGLDADSGLAWGP